MRDKKGKFVKGGTPWNKGKKTGLVPKTAFKSGHKTWNKGKSHGKIQGSKHYRWKGGFWINKSGYKILEIKRNGKRYRIREHRLVMEEYLGRKLTVKEDVHHKDGNKLNNEISNLELMSKSEHSKLHHKLKGGVSL